MSTSIIRNLTLAICLSAPLTSFAEAPGHATPHAAQGPALTKHKAPHAAAKHLVKAPGAAATPNLNH
jgi:hypothetical protein